MFEVRITGTFSTGTTILDQKQAEDRLKELLIKKLKEANIYDASGLWQFTIEKVESEKL